MTRKTYLVALNSIEVIPLAIYCAKVGLKYNTILNRIHRRKHTWINKPFYTFKIHESPGKEILYSGKLTTSGKMR
jgi:hypothetical protein